VSPQFVAYGLSVIETGETPLNTIDWVSMYKSHDEVYADRLRKILVHLYGEDTVAYIDRISILNKG
jgi:hypothetical protein